jgi:cyclophilin family peptidyl-prolyl cis-trans isomerase
LSTANTARLNSGGSQFFINTTDKNPFDQLARVLEGVVGYKPLQPQAREWRPTNR